MGNERIKESPVILGCAQVFLNCFCHLADWAFFVLKDLQVKARCTELLGLALHRISNVRQAKAVRKFKVASFPSQELSDQGICCWSGNDDQKLCCFMVTIIRERSDMYC